MGPQAFVEKQTSSKQLRTTDYRKTQPHTTGIHSRRLQEDTDYRLQEDTAIHYRKKPTTDEATDYRKTQPHTKEDTATDYRLQEDTARAP